MSYNGSGTFQINTSGQPVVAGTVISSTAFNALTADLATGLSTAITKDGQTTTTARIPFAAGISSTLVTDSSSVSTGSIITAGGVGVAKALYVGTTANIAGVLSTTSPNITTSITTPSTSFDLINATATTLNLGGAATTVNVGAATGTMTVANTTLAAKAITASTTLSVTGVTTVQAGTAAAPAITTTGDTNTGIFFPAADTIAFTEGGVESMRISSAGNVGIGGTPANGMLELFKTSGEAVLRINNTAGSAWLTLNGASAGYIHNITNTPTIFTTNGTERMRIDSSGNVGIGTSSPSTYSILTAYGSSAAGFAGVTAINGAGSSGLGGIQMGSDGTYVKAAIALKRETANGAGSIVFYNDSNSDAANWASTDEKMRIDSSGRLLVNTTSDVVGNNPPFIVNGTGFSNGSEFRWTGTTSFYNVMVANGNGFLGGINTNGSTTTYTNLSDYRVKENIEPMQNALGKISLLKPCTFTYKTDGIDGQGFIAHELQEVFSDAVVGEKDAVDADGNPQYQGIDTSFLVATLTAAIQEQQALITALTARITALENK